MNTQRVPQIVVLTLALAPLAANAVEPQSGGYGYSGQGVSQGSGTAGGPAQGQTINGMPPGVGYNNGGGEISRSALQQAALAPEYHFHMVGPTSETAVGSGGGPPLQNAEVPGYVQAKFVTPYGNATVLHHYGAGYPPPLGQGGPNDGNGTNMMASGTVAGNPGMVNWGMTSAVTREEIGNGAWFGGASSGTGNPTPYVGSFSD